MTPSVQALLVAVLVTVATGYAGVRLMPAAWRRRLAASAAAMAARAGAGEVLARRVEAKLSSGGACGSCDSCRACVKPSDGADALSAGDATAAEARATDASDPVAAPTFRGIPIRRVG